MKLRCTLRSHTAFGKETLVLATQYIGKISKVRHAIILPQWYSWLIYPSTIGISP